MTELRKSIRNIATEARPVVERWLDAAEQLAAFGEVCRDQGIEWSPIKALLKASILDERDEGGEGKKVKALVEKADNAVAYADILGLSRNLTNVNFSSGRPSSARSPTVADPVSEESIGTPIVSSRSTTRTASLPPRRQVTTGETAADSCGGGDASSQLAAQPQGPSIDGAVLACGPQETAFDDLDIPDFLDRRPKAVA